MRSASGTTGKKSVPALVGSADVDGMMGMLPDVPYSQLRNDDSLSHNYDAFAIGYLIENFIMSMMHSLLIS